MLTGHGPIDYVVVLASVLLTIRLLRQNPKNLLFYLPTFLTIDFFLPFFSDLTPGRLLPLIIGSWFLMTGKWRLDASRMNWVNACLMVILFSTIFSILQDDAGIRPIVRALSYVNLFVLFIFSCRYVKDEKGIDAFVSGLAVSGVVHGGYSIYQVVAHYVGLPYRGIVRSESVVGSAVLNSGAFRINGLSDEPKRLGLILIAGSIALIYLRAKERDIVRKNCMTVAAVSIFALSLSTYSSSYLASLALWFPSAILLSKKSYGYTVGLLIFFLIAMLLLPANLRFYMTTQYDLLAARQIEVEKALDAQKVYRQEFYAQDFLETRPETILTGVGVGRYNHVLAKTYGVGNAGLSINGRLIPLNSEAMQITFDFGLAGLTLIYCQMLLLIQRVRSKNLAGFLFAAILLFLVVQSFFVQSLPLMMLTGGAVAGVLDGLKNYDNWLRSIRPSY